MYGHGHTTGTKTVSRSSQAWYDKIAEENLAKIEADDAARALATALAHQVGEAVSALPEAASRIAKAATMVQHHQVWPLTNGSYLIGSQSDTQTAHLVTRAGGWHCDCKHMQYRQSLCSHVLAAMLTVKLGTTYQPSYN